MKTFKVQWLMPFLISCTIIVHVGDAEMKAERGYPSIFQAWNGIENKNRKRAPHLLNIGKSRFRFSDVEELHRLAQHDLAFAHPYTLLKIAWNISEEQPYSGLAIALSPSQLNAARQRKQQLLSLNPNLLLLVEIRCRDARYVSRQNEADVENWWEVGYFPPDSPYWLKVLFYPNGLSVALFY